LLLVEDASAVHLDMDGGFAGVYFDKGGFGPVEKPYKIETGLGQGAGDGKAPAVALLDEIDWHADVFSIIDAERDDLFQVVKFRDELCTEKGRELFDREGAVPVGGTAGVDKAAYDVFVHGLKFGKVELAENGSFQY
jgi:hypothetical protein